MSFSFLVILALRAVLKHSPPPGIKKDPVWPSHSQGHNIKDMINVLEPAKASHFANMGRSSWAILAKESY